jgi:protein Xni
MQTQKNPGPGGLLLLVDGLNVFRRVYEANPAPESLEKAQGAMRSSYASLKRALREHRPTHVMLAMDVQGPTWRHALYPEYKAGRTPMPDVLRAELETFLPRLRGEGWHIQAQPGVEADDVIGSAAFEACSLGVPTVVLSTDKDLASLLQCGAQIRNHFDESWRDLAWCEKKFGVGPELILDWLALTGDPVDGIPGVPGVGTKTASKLLLEYGNLSGVLSAASGIKGKLGERLREHTGLARLSRELTELRLDLFMGGGLDWSDMARLTAPN